MNALKSIMLAAGLALGTIAGAQAAQPQQQQPQAHGYELEEGYGFVRFVHASPNADVNQVFLVSTDGRGAATVPGFAQAQYTDMTDFVRLPEGSYDVMIALEAVEGQQLAQVVPTQQLNVSSNGFHTVALIGLVTPGAEHAMPAQQQEQNGFFAWLQGLFAEDAATRDDFGLQVLVLDEEAAQWTVAEQDDRQHLMRVRIVHAAPGTETLELVKDRRQVATAAQADAQRQDIEVLQAVSYGDVSGFAEVDPQEGQLAVRVEGSEEMFIDIAAHDFQPGMIHTVFVTGTPVDQAPLEGFVATTQPVTEEQLQAARDRAAEAEAAARERAAAAEAERTEPAEAEVAEEPADAQVETQVTPVQPAQPAAPAATAPAATPATPTTQDIAWVRFVDTSPNASAEQVLLTTGDGVGLTVEEFAGVEYMDATEYIAIPAGTYDVVVNAHAQLEDQEDFALATPAVSLRADAGNYYTIALMGLAVPADWVATERRGEGFFAWLEGLFTTDGPAEHELGLRTMLLHDDLAAFWADPAHETHIRLVHAAPGTENVELVVNQARAVAADRRVQDVHHVDAAAYGNATGFNTVDTLAGALEVRIEGSQVVILDLADFQLQPGMMHTIFVTGTPVEDVPIEAVVISTAAVDGQPAPAQPAN